MKLDLTRQLEQRKLDEATKPLHVEIESLRQRLAECERERDELAALNAKMLVEYEARMKERDELVEALLAVKEQRIDGHIFPAVVDMNAWHTKVINVLAKLGADKTGENDANGCA